MCTHNQCFRANKRKNIIIFNLKINIFTAVKYCYILHGRVWVMMIMNGNGVLLCHSLSHKYNYVALVSDLCM